jgi:hypothetical protein
MRPSNAFDANPRTAWAVTGLQKYEGNWLRITFTEPTEVSSIAVRQRRRPLNNPTITKLNVRFETADDTPSDTPLTTTSLSYDLNPGQTVLTPRRGSFTAIEFRIDQVEGTTPSGVGFSEIDLFGADGNRLRTEETIKISQLNTNVAANTDDDRQRIAERTLYAFTRSRLNAPLDEEVDLRRIFATAAATAYSARATIEVTPSTPDIVLDTLRNEVVGAYGSNRFQGDIDESTGRNVLDGRPRTAWKFIPSPGESLSLRLPPGSAPNDLTIRTPVASNKTISPIRSVTVAGFRSVVDQFGDEKETVVFGGPDSTRISTNQVCSIPDVGNLCLANTTIPLPGEQVDRIEISVRDIDVNGAGIGKYPSLINDLAIDGKIRVGKLGASSSAWRVCRSCQDRW